MNVEVIKNSTAEKVSLEKDLQKRVFRLITSLIEESDDVLRLMVTGDRINEIKQSEESIEIVFNSTKVFESDQLGGESIKKILLPLTGEFIGSPEDPIITIFVGEDEYFSGPLRNRVGYPKLMEIKSIIFSKIKR
jgi:hypothetical protein